MADLKDEIRVLREKNTELVQKVQHWKMLAAQREDEKLELMKELNEMRLKLSRLRSNGNVQASKLDTALQSASQKALAHLVRASEEIARTIELSKTYMREQKEFDDVLPRWSSIGGTPKTEKVHRVPPMMMGGRSIQPVVSLSRTLLNTTNTRPAATSPNQNRNVTERAVPMHMLQDVYIPLTRIDAGGLQSNNMQSEMEADNSDGSAEDMSLDGSGERQMEESQRMSDDEDYNFSRRLDAVAEEMESVLETEVPPTADRTDNPLEGPSWLLDPPASSTKPSPQSRKNLEPDSTTEVESAADARRAPEPEACGVRVSCEFSPTVRRRKRISSPPPATPRRASPYSPRPPHRRNSNSGRVLKVMVAKMRLDSLSPGSPACKRTATELSLFDAPSPNGATVAGVIVSETLLNNSGAGEPHVSYRRPSQSQERHRSPTLDSRRPSHTQETHGPSRSKETHGPSRSKETRGPSQSQERHHSPTLETRRSCQSQETHGPSQTKETHGLSQSKETRSPSQSKETHGPSQSKETYGPSQSKEIRGPSQSKETHGPSQTKETHGPSQSQESRGPSQSLETRDRDSNMDDTETRVKDERDSRSSRARRHDSSSRLDSRYDSDSGSLDDHSEGRSRRPRKLVSYQEKPLNRKMRR